MLMYSKVIYCFSTTPTYDVIAGLKCIRTVHKMNEKLATLLEFQCNKLAMQAKIPYIVISKKRKLTS